MRLLTMWWAVFLSLSFRLNHHAPGGCAQNAKSRHFGASYGQCASMRTFHSNIKQNLYDERKRGLL